MSLFFRGAYIGGKFVDNGLQRTFILGRGRSIQHKVGGKLAVFKRFAEVFKTVLFRCVALIEPRKVKFDIFCGILAAQRVVNTVNFVGE